MNLRLVLRASALSLMAAALTICVAVETGADVLKKIVDYRSSLFSEAQQKVRPKNEPIDFKALQLQVKVKAEELTKGLDASKLPPSEALDWAQVFNLAGHARDTQSVLNAFIASKPDPKPTYEALTMLIAADWQLKDDKGVVSTLKKLQPYDNASAVDCASLIVTYVPHEMKQLSPDDAAILLDSGVSGVDVAKLNQKQRQHFGTIQRYATEFKIEMYREAGQRDKALKVIDEALKTASESYKSRLAVERNQLTLIGLAAPELKTDKAFGTFPGLSALRGKVVIVDFLAAWCEPCKRAFPGINLAFADLQPKGLEIVGVTHLYGYVTDATKSLTAEQELAGLAEYIKDQKISWPVVVGPNDNFTTYGVPAIPCVVVIGRNGIVRSLNIGYSELSWSDIRREVEKLLAEKA